MPSSNKSSPGKMTKRIHQKQKRAETLEVQAELAFSNNDLETASTCFHDAGELWLQAGKWRGKRNTLHDAKGDHGHEQAVKFCLNQADRCFKEMFYLNESAWEKHSSVLSSEVLPGGGFLGPGWEDVGGLPG
jgi:hypothetical protein